MELGDLRLLKGISFQESESMDNFKDDGTKRVSDGFERYIGDWDMFNSPFNPPTLYIINELKTLEVTLSVQRNVYVQATIEDKVCGRRRVGCSTGNISDIFNRIDDMDNQDIQDYRYKMCVLFYGFICEALCRAGIPLDLVIADLDILDRFVSDSMEFWFKDDILEVYERIDKISKLVPSINIECVDSIPDIRGRKFIFQGKYILLLSYDDRFYLKLSDTEIYRLRRPFFSHSDYQADPDADIAAVWILFESLGFHVDEFLCYEDSSALQVVSSDFEDAKEVTPSSIRGELCFSKKVLDYYVSECRKRYDE